MDVKSVVYDIASPLGIDFFISFKQRLKNIKSNWFLILSALALYGLFVPRNRLKHYVIGYALSCFALILAASQFNNLFGKAKKQSSAFTVLSFLGAGGIAEIAVRLFVSNWQASRFLRNHYGNGRFDVLYSVAIVVAVCAVPFVFTGLSLFYSYLKKSVGTLTKERILNEFALPELCFYALIFAASIIYVTLIFNTTYAFYAPERKLGDFIYTSDTRLIALRPNSYLCITNGQNDLRQALFAIFSMPFLAAPYAISIPFGVFFKYAQFYFMQYVQVAMLFVAVVFLAKLVSKNPFGRASFVLLLCCTYPYLLFSPLMEQYIVAFFYLVTFLYLAQNGRRDFLFFYGAVGTISTSAVLVPFVTKPKNAKRTLNQILQILLVGIGYIFLMLLFFRGNLFVTIGTQIEMFMRFTGKTVSFMQKCMQYTAFVSSCFVPPVAGITEIVTKNSTTQAWRLFPVDHWNFTGIAILLLCVISFVLNRKHAFARISAAWVLFSIFILLILGWGTKENGLILYSLYFGWAFVALIFMLVQAVTARLRATWLSFVICAALSTFLLWQNLPAIHQMVSFAASVCPR